MVEDRGEPCELIIVIGKAGEEMYANGHALARAIGLGLEASVPISHYVRELKGITHQNSNPLMDEYALSMADAVARTLEELYLMR